MTASANSAHRRVSVFTPTARVDLVLPGHLPIAEMLPVVVDFARVGEQGDSGWELGRIGRGPLSPELTLDSAGVRDGDLLDLRPSSLPVAEPVFDEIADVVAAVAAERMGAGARPDPVPALVAAGVLLVGAVGWSWSDRALSSGTSGVLAAVLLVAAIITGRRHHRDLIAAALGTASVAFAAVAAAGVAPAAAPDWAVAAGVIAVAAPLVGLLIRSGAALFSAFCAAGAVIVGASSAAGAFSLTPAEVATGVVVFVVSTVPMVPRWSARIAGLRHRRLHEPDDAPVGVQLDAVRRRSRLALAVAAGLDAGLGCTLSGAAVILADSGDPWSVALAVVALTVLLLRSRSVRDRPQALAIAGPAVVGLLAVAALIVRDLPVTPDRWLPVAAVAVACIVLLAGTSTPHHWSPGLQRALRLFEGALVLAVIPLAVAAVQGYDRLRHL